MKSRTLITALTLFAALSASVRLAAQDAQDRNQKHTRYSIKGSTP
jgi:hypothetical protein